MKYDRKKTVIVSIIFCCVLLCLFLYLTNEDKDVNVSENVENNLELINDPSEFYTVSNCITKYITYVSSRDNESVYTLLDPSYIKKNSITLDNVFKYIETFDGQYTQNTIRIYSEYVNYYMTKYYVKYSISKYLIDSSSEEIIQYAIVVLNEKNLSFSIIPYDGELFINE